MTYNSTKKKKSKSHKETKTANFFLELARIILGLVFIFSGFVKAIDPLGSAYKIEDYLMAFGHPFSYFIFLSLPFAILLSTFELTLGFNLILKIYPRITIILTAIFLTALTALTLYLALKNPITDCGCFGDVIILTNWQTFYKNLVLISLAVLLLIYRKRFTPLFLPHIEPFALVIFALLGIAISIYCYHHLPLIDFLPYKVGVNIPEAMHIPEGAKTDQYETTFIYEKNGQRKEFTLENYPKDDSTWVFIDQKTTLKSIGYRPPIHDFVIFDTQDEDITDIILQENNSAYLLIMYDVNKASKVGAKKAEKVYQKAQSTNSFFCAVTASSDEEIQKFVQATGVTYPFCKADPIMLKTIVRANPGLVLIKNGTIMGKWNWRDF